ncbi:ABC transporter ATP-binding protein [Candidatus Parcubacteria bacterium]|nr:ABC transporter ATP-binding protein [Patescibacteria group bacterium]MBU4309191.1 ABC transporter ATP-binding protein [Patescibacteria group bacterium]MBU4432516.1 ABC transporter ATP-binding protein [Patescibacteria group bacterium]MBU4577552.1 ABC transporter ATP-binding protein [Patescibacteria group bacterium]MCG2697239.1 ABC transporter ATP-binding protein [Candidatus Parcubacteria bacterium]
MIKVENLQKEFHSGEVVTKVLHGLSFGIAEGEFVAIMGPSGSGKSTLMHILGLLDRATEGHYFLDGKDVVKLDDEELAILRNEKIGFVFQSFNLLPRTTVFENVKLPLTYSKNKIDMDQRVKEVLESVGLGHRMDYYTNQISGGEKQRVAIARALINKPSVLFADEPTGNLDSKSGVQIMQILQKLNDAGNTIILVTHETYTAEHAKRIVLVRDGEIVSDQPVINRRFAKDGELLK